MTNTFYPARLYTDEPQGRFGVEIFAINVNAAGDTPQEALSEAAAILQEVVDDLRTDNHPLPAPARLESLTLTGDDTLVMVPCQLPAENQRINIVLPSDLIARIDAIAPNRSAFLAEGARARLRALSKSS